METNVNSVIGDQSLKKLVVTEQRPPMWNATFSSFFPNEVKIHCLLSLSLSLSMINLFTTYSVVLTFD